MSFFFVRSSDTSAPPSSVASSSSSAASLSTSSSSHTHTRRRHRRRHASPSPQRQSSWYSLMPATIPDLRLEQSYLATVRGFIHELSPEEARREKEEASASGEGGGGGDFVVSGRIGGAQKEGEEGHGEPELWIGRLRIDWLPLLHVTLRDQVFSTLGSGIFWAVFNVFAGQARGYVGGYVGGVPAVVEGDEEQGGFIGEEGVDCYDGGRGDGGWGRW